MVFQNYALYPHMSVADNMGFALKLSHVPKAERAAKVRETAALLDLEPYLDRKPKALSGGQRQRVAMGRAIVREPSVFLMDEPLSNLDAKLRVETRANIASLQARLGTTTIYVTHDQVEAMTMGHRVAVLKDGQLQQVDTPRKLYDRPDNVFVAGFIGSPAMNLRTATLDRRRARRSAERRVALPRGRSLGAAREAGLNELVVGLRPEASSLAVGRRAGTLQLDGHAGRGARRRRLRLRRRSTVTRPPTSPGCCAASSRTVPTIGSRVRVTSTGRRRARLQPRDRPAARLRRR